MKMLKSFGLSAAVLYAVLTLISYLYYPRSYSPLRNWLSDLGNPLINAKGAVFYNAGCLVTSLLLIGFYLGMNAWRTGDKVLRRLLTIAQAAGIISSLALILAAVFNIGEHFSLHSLFSMLLIIGLTWFLSFANTALLRHPRFGRWIGFYGLAAAAVTLIYGVFFNTPLGEWITIAVFILYVCILAVKADFA